jgi:hypothetical protein
MYFSMHYTPFGMVQAWHEARARTAQAKEAESKAELGEATAAAQVGVTCYQGVICYV